MKICRSAGVVVSVVVALVLGVGVPAQAAVGEAEAFQNRLNIALQKMLDAVVGPGRAVVTTAVELDLDQVETVRKTYTVDPSVGALSEELSRRSSAGYESSSVVRANALNSVQETRVDVPGEIAKLSIAVLVDEDAAIDLDQLQMLLSTAAGADFDRGDVVTVAAMPLHRPAAAPEAAAETPETDRRGLYAAVGAVVVLLLVLLAFSARRRARKRAAAQRPRAALEGQRTVVATATVDRQRMISQTAADDPQRAADILRGWAGRNN